MSVLEVATAHARDRSSLAERIRREFAAAWKLVDPARISESWSARIGVLLPLLTGAQHLAVAGADRYVAGVLDAQDLSPAAEGALNASSLAGVASDGRDLASLLAQPGITAKVALAAGRPIEFAMSAGGALAELIGHTQVADAGRVADQVAMVSRRDASGQIRMVVGKTCARCLILAGRWYRWNAGFNRHPKCDCIGIPGRENVLGDLQTDPKAAFAAMDRAEQDRVFGKAGAEAIRSGADIGKVVNARRGMQTASVGGREVLVTTEGTTTRAASGLRLGAADAVKQDGDRYRRAARARLMPEQIFRDAKDRDDAIRLLRLHGYIL